MTHLDMTIVSVRARFWISLCMYWDSIAWLAKKPEWICLFVEFRETIVSPKLNGLWTVKMKSAILFSSSITGWSSNHVWRYCLKKAVVGVDFLRLPAGASWKVYTPLINQYWVVAILSHAYINGCYIKIKIAAINTSSRKINLLLSIEKQPSC